MKITELQKDLAATFRWTARLNMNEGVANHFSACVPGKSNEFYVNKAGIDNKNEILLESTLLKFKNLAAVIVIPALLTPGINARI